MSKSDRQSGDEKIRIVRSDRQLAAAVVRSRLDLIERVRVPQPRQPEIDYEREILEEAYSVLNKPGLESPSERMRARERASEAKWLEHPELFK